jgi:RNA polymerase sigma-70 factor (ECF subfamily)
MKRIDFRTDVLPLKDRLFRLALRVTLDRAEAEDITQETLVRLWEARDQWPQIQSIEAYATTVCRRLALDYNRRVRPSTSEAEVVDTPASAPGPDDMLDQRQRIQAIRNLIDQLPEVQRTVIQLRDIEGLRYDEIAQATGLSETQVKVYLHRARKKLKETLAPQQP